MSRPTGFFRLILLVVVIPPRAPGVWPAGPIIKLLFETSFRPACDRSAGEASLSSTGAGSSSAKEPERGDSASADSWRALGFRFRFGWTSPGKVDMFGEDG